MESVDKLVERFLAPGSGSGDGSGSGYGDGDGSGYGSGSGYGDGDGSGDGSGSGYGDLKEFQGRKVYYIDKVPTLIDAVKLNLAKGHIIGNDLTLQPCYIARHGGCFAHGDTPQEALRDAVAKWQETRPVEERLDEFVRTFPELDKPYSGLFDWHHTLTGSCEAGRKEWCRTHGYQPTDEITVRTFITQTVNDYGGYVIRQLADRYDLKLKDNDCPGTH